MSLTKKLLATIALFCASAFASQTTLTGTIRDEQGNGINGTLVMRLPIPAQDQTTNVAVAPIPVTFSLNNGVISGGAPLYDVMTLQPQGLYYIARAYDTTGVLEFYGNYIVTGGTFNLGAATPTSVTTSNISYLTPVFSNGTNTWTGTNTWGGPSIFNGPVTFNGTINNALPGSISIITNDATTGTTLNKLAQFKFGSNPSTAIVTNYGGAALTYGALGIVTAGAGTTGSATVQSTGIANCVFDGATTAGDYVLMSTSTAGNCVDSGLGGALPFNAMRPSGQIVGRVLSSNISGGTYQVELYPPESYNTGFMYMAFCGGTIGAANATAYMLYPGASGTSIACTNTVPAVQNGIPNPIPCTAHNLTVQSRTAGAVAGSGVVHVRQSGNNTTLTCTIGTGSFCTDTTHNVSIIVTSQVDFTVTTGQANDTLSDLIATLQCN